MNAPNILIIEDDTEIRESLRELLELEGYSVATASNGREGLDLLQKKIRPRLILLDLMMPIMNGWEFLESQKKEQPPISDIPVVVVSAAGDRAKSVLATGFIKKPLDFEHLLDYVRRYCNSSAAS